jgi:hypothetical protein
MTESNIIWRFLFCALAAWRLMQPLAGETQAGIPRERRPGFHLYCRFVNCFHSLNLWISLPIAIWLSSGWFGLLMQWQSIASPIGIHEWTLPSSLLRRSQ